MVAAEVDLQALLKRVEQLEARVRELETGLTDSLAASPAPAAAAPSIPPEREEISEETLAVISAAIASFLGVKAKIRQVRLVGREAWAQQGRVSIMASHRWAMHRQ